MGLKSFVFRQSGAAKQLENRKAELKGKLAATRAEVASLKEELRLAKLATGQPPPRQPGSRKRKLTDALTELKHSASASVIPDVDQVLARVQTADLRARYHDQEINAQALPPSRSLGVGSHAPSRS